MVSLREMNERMNGWMAEKPTFDNSTTLRIDTNDRVLGYFCSSGDDGDSLIKAYRSHAYDMISKTNSRYSIFKYCPNASGEQGVPCANCQVGNQQIKERMSIWMYVTNILHAQMPQARQGQQQVQFDQIAYQGAYYFNEEVQGFKLWETSAWKESPWLDICKFYEMYGNSLHKFMFQMDVVGQGMNRRFKLYPLPNSAFFPPELYARAKQECTPITDILKPQASQTVQTNPQMQQQQQPQGGVGMGLLPNGQQPGTIVPFAPPGTPVSIFAAPPAAQPIATLAPALQTVAAPTIPTLTPGAVATPPPAPVAESPAPVVVEQPPTLAPVAAPVAEAPVVQPTVGVISPIQPLAPPAVQEPAPTAEGETPAHRPLSSMF